ncbi:MAG: glycosyltransferase family 39 protein [Caldilineaceae bacterium]
MTARARALLILFVLIGFGLRVFQLDGQSLWYDEGVTATIAQRNVVDLTRWTANDIQPPLYYYIVGGWGRIAGWSEWALRYPSAAFGVLAIALLAVLALRLAQLRAAALLAALLAAVHPLLVYYGQEARMYTLLVLLGVLAAYVLARAADRDPPGWRLWAAYVVVATAAIYTHYFAIFLLLGLGCAWILDVVVRRRQLRHVGVPEALHEGVQPTQSDAIGGSSRVARTPRAGPPGTPTCPSLGATLWPFVMANAVVVFLYLPWLANLVTRLRVDRSYWTGTLKLHEALLDIAPLYSGETMSERFRMWLLVGYGAITWSQSMACGACGCRRSVS